MAYDVIKTFRDNDDKNKLYVKDKDQYPREGLNPSQERVESLLNGTNLLKVAFIAESDSKEAPKKDDDEDLAIEQVNPSEVASMSATDKEQTPDEAVHASNEDSHQKSIEDLTNPELKAYLDELNVDYLARDTKDELVKKLRSALVED